MSSRIVRVLRCPACGAASLAEPGEGCGWCRAAEQLGDVDRRLGEAMAPMMSAMAAAVTRQAELIGAAFGPMITALMEARGVRGATGDPTGDGPLSVFPMAEDGEDPPSAACGNCGRDVLAHVGTGWRRECPGWEPLPRS